MEKFRTEVLRTRLMFYPHACLLLHYRGASTCNSVHVGQGEDQRRPDKGSYLGEDYEGCQGGRGQQEEVGIRVYCTWPPRSQETEALHGVARSVPYTPHVGPRLGVRFCVFEVGQVQF